MFCLHVSNRTENLLTQMAEVIRVDKQPGLFAPELFLIQSQGMERMVAQTLADHFKSFCNFKFFLPVDFLASMADTLEMGIGPKGFDRQTLGFRIENLLTDIGDEVYRPLRYYLSGTRSDVKRFQLARRLANTFDQYQLMRPDMLEGWEEGRLATAHVSEPWQMALWRRLIDQPGGSVHRGMLFRSVIETLAAAPSESLSLPKRVCVIGLHTMPPIFLEYLNVLAVHMDVHFFLLSPCRHYWGDVQTKRQRFLADVRLGHTGEDQFGEYSHPLLASLGRQGRDLQVMMLEGAQFTLEFASYEEPSGQSLLHRVQLDLLEGQVGETEGAGVPDDSVQIVSCHSKLRELEVLREQILHFLYTDEELELRDIIVMAPDIQEYAPLIPAVFNDIQHSIADRSTRRRNSVFAGFLLFLELFSGRFGWSEMLDILRQPAVFPRFGLAETDLETLEYWVCHSGIRWGLSAEQRSDSGITPFTEGSWKAGLERMLMGYATGAGELVDGILPFECIEGSGALALGGLYRFVEIVEDARQQFKVERTLGGWSELLLELIASLFVDSGEQELMELRVLVADLGRAMEGFSEKVISFDVIREWFRESAQERRTSSGFLRGQLTFCSMLPMRSIPFKVVCLLGLNDGVYPKPDNSDNFDLMGEATGTRLGDRSARADDRYQFLEAILAAREKLYLSYIGQSDQTNEKRPPSVVLVEFLELLSNGYGIEEKGMVVHHPLHSFSSRYFSPKGEGGLRSYDQEACAVARKIRQPAQEPVPWWQGQLDPPGKEVRVERFLSYFSHPQRYFFRECLGLQLFRPEELAEEREVFHLQGLDRYQAEQGLMAAALAGDALGAELLKKGQIRGQWPLGASGRLFFEQKKVEIDAFADGVQEQGMGLPVAPLDIDCMVGEYHLQGRLNNLYQNGAMLVRYGKLKGRDLLACWLHHLMASRAAGVLRTCIVTTDATYTFSGTENGPSLDFLLDVFAKGHESPSDLYLEPAFEYARQMRGRGPVLPIDKAVKKIRDQLEKGYEPETELLLRHWRGEVQLGEEFEQLATKIMAGILEAADV